VGYEFHQQAADEVVRNLFGVAGKNGLEKGREVLDGRGWVRKCPGMLTDLGRRAISE
jgi:hypothetical protein